MGDGLRCPECGSTNATCLRDRHDHICHDCGHTLLPQTDTERDYSLGVAQMDNGHQILIIRAGHRGSERIVPPAGEAHAFDRDLWAREVQISISPRGRSVRVHVDGEEVDCG